MHLRSEVLRKRVLRKLYSQIENINLQDKICEIRQLQILMLI